MVSADEHKNVDLSQAQLDLNKASAMISDYEGQIVHRLQQNTTNIRNMSVVAHVDHGKSTLTDCLLIANKIVSKTSNGARYMDTRKDEQERGITIKATAVSLHCNISEDVLEAYNKKTGYKGEEFLINLIDSPGHVDFSSEVTAALRVTDGALVVIDCVDGICVQTETVLRQAIDEMVVPTLVLNKLDRAMLELQYTKAELHDVIKRRVETFNAKLSSILGEHRTFVKALDPGCGDVSFCSGLQGWGFTLNTFARMYLTQKGKHTFENEKNFSKMLWSFKYYCTSADPFDPAQKFEKIKSGSQIPAGCFSPFEVFILNPIYKVKDMCFSGDIEGIISYLGNFNVDFSKLELKGEGKNLFKMVFKAWLPAAKVLTEQIVTKLPSPIESQAMRADLLYTGPVGDEAHRAIATCDSSDGAPIMVYVSKMIPDDSNGFIAFGRVFSGNVKPGMKLYVQTPDYVPDPTSTKKNYNVTEKTITKVLIVNPKGSVSIPNCSAGNIVGLVGVESSLKKTGTIASLKHCYNIKTMKFSVSPVVKVAVTPKKATDLKHFKEGLEKLAKSDPLCLIEMSDLGQATIACAGELHLEIILGDLKEFAKCDFTVEKPQVKYYEGFGGSITKSRMRKSANKHNRVHMTCEPLADEIVANIPHLMAKDPKEIAAKFRELLNMDDDWIKNIMYFAPEVEPLNVFVDESKGIQYLNEVKEHLFEGFKIATKSGPLVGECMRGGKFNLVDLVLHSDSIHRGANQMIRPVEDLVRGLLLEADPILYEPIFSCTITAPADYITACENVIKNRRGYVEDWKTENNSSVISAYLPVYESFGLNKKLKEVARGQSSFSLVFSHYEPTPGSLEKETSPMFQIVDQVRKYKNISLKLDFNDYYDTL